MNMKRRTLIIINIIVSVIILTGFLFITILNNNNFNKIFQSNIENTLKLSSSTIYGEIDNKLTKPIFVSQTISNDLFLKDWLVKEQLGQSSAEHEKLMQQYLVKYKEQYNYDSVFLVSSKTNIYYHFEGIHKKIDPSNLHDVWYYDFVKEKRAYDLDVDVDEANNNELTVFINCRVIADDGSLLGVVGVGIKMDYLQQLLKTYELNYDLKSKLIDSKGVVQIDSDEKNIETLNFFDKVSHAEIKDEILNNKSSMEMFWHPESKNDNCVIAKYINNLDWYIVIEKNVLPIKEQITAQFGQDLILISIIIILVLLLSFFITSRYNRLLINKATTDDVTDLPNIKMFQEIFRRNAKRVACKQGTFFMFDIDYFKKINDECGHLQGNAVLYETSLIVKKAIGNKGIIARFGGDEFIGVIYAPPEEADIILRDFFDKVSKAEYLPNSIHITISVGATRINRANKIDVFVKEVDQAMYKSKEQGRNQITYFKS